MSAVVINASPSTRSRTHVAAAFAAQHLRADLIDLASLDASALLGRRESDALTEALERTTTCEALVVATPVYKATYSGLLKVFVDQLGPGALEGRHASGIATAYRVDHAHGTNDALRVLLGELGATVGPTGVALTHEDFDPALSLVTGARERLQGMLAALSSASVSRVL